MGDVGDEGDERDDVLGAGQWRRKLRGKEGGRVRKKGRILGRGGTKRTRFTKSVLPPFRCILHLETCVIYKTVAPSWKPARLSCDACLASSH